jgi:hypothetical protein
MMVQGLSVLPEGSSLLLPSDRGATDARLFIQLLALCRTVNPDDVVIVCNHQEMATAHQLAHAVSELPIGVHIFDAETSGLECADGRG